MKDKGGSILRKIKEETIHTLARIGRKHRLLRYPILVVLVVFVFIYNLLLYGFIHFKMRERLARGLAMAMTVVLVFTSVDLTVLAMSGDSAQTESYEEVEGETPDPVKMPEGEEPEKPEESVKPEASAAPEETANQEESAAPETTAEPETTQTPDMTVSDGNAQGVPEMVNALQQRINALPTVEEFIDMTDGTYVEDSLWNEVQMNIYYEMQDIADIYDSLSEEEQAMVDVAKLMELFEYINSAVMPLAGTVNYEPITISKESLNGNAIWGATEDYYGVQMDGYAHFYSASRENNGGLPVNGRITMEKSKVPYQLASGDDSTKAYDGNDCIRLTSYETARTMQLETIGVYQNIYVFATAGGPGGDNYANFSVKLTYTDGSTEDTDYRLYDWYGTATVSGVEKYRNIKRMFNSNNSIDYTSSSDGPVIQSAAITANPQKLLQSITFTMKGKNGNSDTSGLYCCIFAVTGATPAGVPKAPVATQASKTVGDNTGAFTAHWNSVEGATGYRLDVATDRQFKHMVTNYNNSSVGNMTQYNVSGDGINNDTIYYYRVRAYNDCGQSLSSNRVATDLPIWIKDALEEKDYDSVSYDAETNMVTFKRDVTLKDTMQIPGEDSTIINLGGNTVTAPAGSPAISAGEKNTELTINGTSSDGKKGSIVGSTGSDGNGVAAIDFGNAGVNSTITVSGSEIRGGDGVGSTEGTTTGNAGNGGVGIIAGSGSNVKVESNATVTGGNGGSTSNGTGGNGGAGISGGKVSVSQNGNVTGGNGGDSAKGTGGNGGTGVTGSSGISSSGNVSGGNGGDSTNGNGGAGGTGVNSDSKVTNNGNVSGGNGGNGTGTAGSAGAPNSGNGEVTGGGSKTEGSAGTVHNHTWTYVGKNNTILAYCTAEEGSNACHYYGEEKALKLVLTAEAGVCYNGQSQNIAKIESNTITEITGQTAGKITYYDHAGEITEAPVEAGNYTAKVMLGGATAIVNFEIAKAPQNVTLGMPGYTYGDAVSTPTITGAQEDPQITYYYNQTDSNADGIKWENITPSTLNVGDYYLYAVLEATGNYQKYTTDVVKFHVSPRTAELSWGGTAFVYNGQPQRPAATVTNLLSGDNCTVTVTGEQTDSNAATGTVNYTATATGLDNPNYVLPAEGATTQFTIGKAEQTAPVVTAKGETILGKKDGNILKLTTAMEYRAEGEETYTKAVSADQEFAPGTYYVRYAEQDNYNTSADTEVVIRQGRKLQVVIPAEQNGYQLTSENTELSWKGSTKLTFTVNPGYSKTEGFAIKINGKEVAFDEQGACTITDASEDQVITVEGVADITAPEGSIEIADSIWREFLNKVTFGLFFKEQQEVTITAADAGSKVKEIAYYVSEETLDLSAIQQLNLNAWQIYHEKFTIAPKHGYIVYAKLTDNAGNVRYLSSDGVVLYTDAEAVTTAINYYKASGEDKTAEVRLNGNTIREILDENGNLLHSGTDYSVSGEKITLKNAYLQSLTVRETPYVLTIFYNPLGKEYKDGGSNQNPATTGVQLFIVRQAGRITNISDPSKTFDGTAVTTPTYVRNTGADVTVEYKLKGEPDTSYTTETPGNAGEYTVRLSAPADENYTDVTVTRDFRIYAREITAQITAQDKEYDGTDKTTVTASVETGVTGQTISLSGITGKFVDYNAGQEKDVAVDSSKAVVIAGEKNTLLSNYHITYPTVVKANISRATLTIWPEQSQKTYGEKDPKVNYQADGFKNGERQEELLEGSLSRESGEDVGTYKYTVGTLKDKNGNYEFRMAEGSEVPVFTIIPRKLSADNIWIGTDENGDTQVIVRDLLSTGTKNLVKDVDYTVTTTETTDGDTITVCGKGNYRFEVTKKVAKPEWKGNTATTVVMEPEIEKMKPALKPVAEKDAKNTLLNIVKDQYVKERLESNDQDVDYSALIYLEVKQADTTVTEEEKKQISDSMSASKVLPPQIVAGKYIDISLYMTYTVKDTTHVLESGTEKITDTSDKKLGIGEGYKQVIRLTIPEELRNTDSSIDRSYYIIRVHENENGENEVDVLNTVQEGYVITFETDKFSTYVIAYADQKKPSTTSGSDNDAAEKNISKDSTAQTQAVEAPKTGDDSHMALWMLLLFVSVCGMAGIGIVTYHKRKKTME